METFENDIKEHIINRLEDYENQIIYTSDLSFTLSEYENMNGVWIFGTHKAKEYIRDNWNAADKVFEYYDSELGMSVNPFENPEAFTVYMLIYGIECALNDLSIISDKWDEEITLDADTIKRITAELNGEDSTRWACPECSDIPFGYEYELIKNDDGSYYCPKCGCFTVSPADDGCIQL